MFPRPIIAITLVVAFISQGVSGQNTSLIPTLSLTPSSTWTLSTSTWTLSTSSQDISTTTAFARVASTEATSSTASGPSMTASVTTMNPTSEATTEAPTTTKAPSRKTCGWVCSLWKRSWNNMYKNNTQFISNTTEKLQKFLEHGFFSDSSKYGHVKVSDLQVKDKDGDIDVKFKLRLVVKNNAGYIEDVIKMWKKFGNESFTEQEFRACGVTFKDWKAKDGECKKCSDGGAGPIIIETKCEPEEQYSCNGVKTPTKTTKESSACVEYCSAGVQKREISTFILVLGIVLAFSVNFWK